MKPLNLLLVFTFVFASLFATTSCKNLKTKVTASKEQPNIILFMVDDMGWQDTSLPFYKERTPFNEIYETPNMERLAAQGVKFTQAYACSVCSPTRTSLMSGMNAAHHRVTNWTLKRGKDPVAPVKGLSTPAWNLNGAQPCDSIEQSLHITSLPEILRQNGYKTIHAGKAHWGTIGTPGANPCNLGFDVNIAGHAAGGPASYYGTANFANGSGKPSVWDIPGLEKYHGKDIFLTEALTLEAIDAVDVALDENKPFYLYMAHYAVHAPIMPDSRFVDKYLAKGLPKVEAAYASLLEGMDKSLGDLMDHIEAKGIADNTIVIFMSDNGGLSAHARAGKRNTHNKPLSSGKGSAHEGGVREPMIVKWPGITKSNTQCDDYLIIEDFFPSILEMASIDTYKTVQPIDGHSFVPLLKGGKGDYSRPLYWHYPNNWGPSGPGIGATSAVRVGDWKLIYYHLDESFELFNLVDDIGESNNLAEMEVNKVQELSSILGNYLRSVEAQMPTHTTTNQMVAWPDRVSTIVAKIN